MTEESVELEIGIGRCGHRCKLVITTQWHIHSILTLSKKKNQLGSGRTEWKKALRCDVCPSDVRFQLRGKVNVIPGPPGTTGWREAQSLTVTTGNIAAHQRRQFRNALHLIGLKNKAVGRSPLQSIFVIHELVVVVAVAVVLLLRQTPLFPRNLLIELTSDYTISLFLESIRMGSLDYAVC